MRVSAWLRISPSSFSTHKKPPLKGEVPAKRAEGFRSPTPQGRGSSVSRRDHNQVYRRATTRRMGAQVQRKSQAYSQLLFGRGGLGERRFS